MCTKEFFGYACGHCTFPKTVECPLTKQNPNFPQCAYQAENRLPTLDNEMCPACSRAQWNMDVLSKENEHRALHFAGRCSYAHCRTAFTEEEKMEAAGDFHAFRRAKLADTPLRVKEVLDRSALEGPKVSPQHGMVIPWMGEDEAGGPPAISNLPYNAADQAIRGLPSTYDIPPNAADQGIWDPMTGAYQIFPESKGTLTGHTSPDVQDHDTASIVSESDPEHAVTVFKPKTPKKLQQAARGNLTSYSPQDARSGNVARAEATHGQTPTPRQNFGQRRGQGRGRGRGRGHGHSAKSSVEWNSLNPEDPYKQNSGRGGRNHARDGSNISNRGQYPNQKQKNGGGYKNQSRYKQQNHGHRYNNYQYQQHQTPQYQTPQYQTPQYQTPQARDAQGNYHTQQQSGMQNYGPNGWITPPSSVQYPQYNPQYVHNVTPVTFNNLNYYSKASTHRRSGSSAESPFGTTETLEHELPVRLGHFRGYSADKSPYPVPSKFRERSPAPGDVGGMSKEDMILSQQRRASALAATIAREAQEAQEAAVHAANVARQRQLSVVSMDPTVDSFEPRSVSPPIFTPSASSTFSVPAYTPEDSGTPAFNFDDLPEPSEPIYYQSASSEFVSSEEESEDEEEVAHANEAGSDKVNISDESNESFENMTVSGDGVEYGVHPGDKWQRLFRVKSAPSLLAFTQTPFDPSKYYSNV